MYSGWKWNYYCSFLIYKKDEEKIHKEEEPAGACDGTCSGLWLFK